VATVTGLSPQDFFCCSYEKYNGALLRKNNRNVKKRLIVAKSVVPGPVFPSGAGGGGRGKRNRDGRARAGNFFTNPVPVILGDAKYFKDFRDKYTIYI
jgi:hypothetical protein